MDDNAYIEGLAEVLRHNLCGQPSVEAIINDVKDWHREQGLVVHPVYSIDDYLPSPDTCCFYFFKPFDDEPGYWHIGRYHGKDTAGDNIFGGRSGFNTGPEVTHWSPILPDPTDAAKGDGES